MPRVINSGINSPFELLSGNVIFKTFPHFSDVASIHMQYHWIIHIGYPLTYKERCDSCIKTSIRFPEHLAQGDLMAKIYQALPSLAMSLNTAPADMFSGVC